MLMRGLLFMRMPVGMNGQIIMLVKVNVTTLFYNVVYNIQTKTN